MTKYVTFWKWEIMEMIKRSWVWRNGHVFEQTMGDSGGQRSLACYNLCMRWQSIEHELVTEQQPQIIFNLSSSGAHRRLSRIFLSATSGESIGLF